MSENLDDVRERLATRREACFERIDDAVSELLVLHIVGTDEIRARVEADTLQDQALADENTPGYTRLLGGHSWR